MRIIDFHTHILPEIDDGAKDINMSLAMLELAYDNDAETVILTPHVNATSDFKDFLSVRKDRFDKLSAAIRKSHISCPEILLGAEVLLDSSLSEKKNVRSLCIEGTELLLLELPYAPWNSWYNHEIYTIMSKHEVTPVMAHIERYMRSPKDIKKLDALISFGVKFQVNASSFLSFKGRRIIRELAAEGLIHAIASDAHNLTRRSPDMKRAFRAFDHKFGADFVDHIYGKTSKLLEDNKIKK